MERGVNEGGESESGLGLERTIRDEGEHDEGEVNTTLHYYYD